LDPGTESEIIGEVQDLLKGKTVIYCAHRESCIKGVDKVHVLKEGKIVESDSYASLKSDPASHFNQVIQCTK